MLSTVQGYRPDLPTFGYSHNGGAHWNRATQQWEHTGKAVCERAIWKDPRSDKSLDESERAFGKPPKDIRESGLMLAQVLDGQVAA